MFKENEKSAIRKIVFDNLLACPFFDAGEAQDVYYNVINLVIADVEETADENFNDSDVRMALSRVLRDKIGC